MSTDQVSLLQLVTQASPLVQGVMLLLVAASLVSWFLIVQRSSLLRDARRQLEVFEQHLRSENDLGKLLVSANAQAHGIDAIFNAAYREYQALLPQLSQAPDAVMEALQRALRMAIATEEERLNHSLTFLATVGSTSPYIGLFGTVWGIMNSFIGLSDTQQATLAAVAPGIAEALVATAMGLFAAIPAVIAYNRLSAGAETLLSRYFRCADALTAQWHRHAYLSGR